MGTRITIYTMGGQVVTGKVVQDIIDSEQEIIIIKNNEENYFIINVNTIEVIK